VIQVVLGSTDVMAYGETSEVFHEENLARTFSTTLPRNLLLRSRMESGWGTR